jgi:diamine N-acetyltransferase
MSNLRIRYATEEDKELIADMSRETFFQTFAPFNSKADMDSFMTERFTREALMEEVGLPENIFFLAYHDDLPAGYVRLREGSENGTFNDIPSIEIARIYAAAEFIGKGVGSFLMEECIRVARERKKQILWLGVWEKNDRAIKFYTKWGFEKYGEHIFMLGNDAQTDWLMKRSLSGL